MDTEPEPTARPPEGPTTHRSGWRALTRHYLEMVVAMLVAMAVLGMARSAVGLAVPAHDRPTLAYLLMAVDMSIGMAAVMRWRRHSWRHVAEMCAAMFLPAPLFPLLGGVLSTDALMLLAHVVMLVAMLAVLLLRRDVYAGPGHHPRGGRDDDAGPRWRLRRVGGTTAKVASALVIALAVPAVVAAPSVTDARAEFYTEPPGRLPDRPAPAPAAHDPAKPTAVVVLGNEGTNAADALPPFEVLAASGAFNVYTVAEERRLVPLVGGLDVVPDLGYQDLAALLDAPPDVIVVPQIEDEPRPDSPVIGWLDEQRRSGAPLIVSVCVGAEILAEAGYLDGRSATSHWLGLMGCAARTPRSTGSTTSATSTTAT